MLLCKNHLSDSSLDLTNDIKIKSKQLKYIYI